MSIFAVFRRVPVPRPSPVEAALDAAALCLVVALGCGAAALTFGGLLVPDAALLPDTAPANP